MSNSILIVDGDPVFGDAVKRFFERKGYNAQTVQDGPEALEMCRRLEPELVLLDLELAAMDGVECLKQVKRRFPETEVIVVSGSDDPEKRGTCIQEGAFGYQVKPSNLADLFLETRQALEHRTLVLENKCCQEGLKKMEEQKIADDLLTILEPDQEAFLNTVKTLVNLLEIYNPFLAGHSKRVAFWAREIAREMKLDEKTVYELEVAGMLHDLGVIGIPQHVNRKPLAQLTEEEKQKIRQHPIFSQKILQSSERLKKVGTMIRHHLERLDGTGTPDGLVDPQIPLGSKILGVANAFDELVSRRRFTKEAFHSDGEKLSFALLELYRFMGTRFQADVIEALERVQKKFLKPKADVVEVTLEKLQPGMILAADINTTYGTVFMAEGTKLDALKIAQLRNFDRVSLQSVGFLVFKKPF